jgi:hypothetical protein
MVVAGVILLLPGIMCRGIHGPRRAAKSWSFYCQPLAGLSSDRSVRSRAAAQGQAVCSRRSAHAL